MNRKLVLAALLLASGGCRMCSDCCDYSSPVADGPYAGCTGRAGSNSSGEYVPIALPEATAKATSAAAPAQPVTPAPLEAAH